MEINKSVFTNLLHLHIGYGCMQVSLVATIIRQSFKMCHFCMGQNVALLPTTAVSGYRQNRFALLDSAVVLKDYNNTKLSSNNQIIKEL